MKSIIVFATALLLFNAAHAIENGEQRALACTAPDYGPISSVIGYLLGRGDVTPAEFSKYYSHDSVSNGLWTKKITIKPIGLKKIGPLPWYQELLTPEMPYPGDGPDENSTLYELVQHVRVKNEAGKTFEFLVVSNVTDNDCDRSSPLVIETSPQYRVLGAWEDNLQAWERIKKKGKEITPNLIK
jgi:hypothetical protein